MKSLTVIFIFSLILQLSTAPPVTQKKTEDEHNENEIGDDKETGLENYMEYHRYLKEVVDALESDPQFRDKLEKAEEADIRSGKIAKELEFVNHKVRTKLDELKRQELERLRHLANKQYEIENGLNVSHEKVGINPGKEHLDHENPHTFEIEDLKKLIAQSTKDLAEADRKRREEFKQYELQKEFEKQEKLRSMDEQHKKEFEEQLKLQEEKHKKHKPLHHPGSKQQLEEVWEKQDHMEQQEFDPKTFFMMHDLDGNGVWDQDEVKALFIKELDKMYQEGAPEDDMRERIEEMERMREHVFGEVDQNKDGLISYNEFIDQTKKQDFQEDKGWETLDENRQFTEEEYKQFEKQRLAEVEKMVAQGMLPPQPGAPVYYDPHAAQFAQQYYPNHPGQPMHPGQHPQQMHPNQVHPGQMHPGQVHPNQMHHAQQQQMHHGQHQQQMHHGQQQQMHPQQVHYQGQPQYQQHGQPQYQQQGQMHPQQAQMHHQQAQMHHAQQQAQLQQQHAQMQQQQAQLHAQQQAAKMQAHQQQQQQQQQQPVQAQQLSVETNEIPKGQLNPGQLPQAQVNPQQLPQAPTLNQQPNLQLNTNEVLPNQKQAAQAQAQKPVQAQQPLAQNSVESQPNVQQV